MRKFACALFSLYLIPYKRVRPGNIICGDGQAQIALFNIIVNWFKEILSLLYRESFSTLLIQVYCVGMADNAYW